MVQKVITILLFLGAQTGITWYGNFTGKLPSAGTFLGVAYDSVVVRSLVTQIEYVWVVILINVLFSLGFKTGFASFTHFLTLISLWIASGPVAAVIFNAVVVRERIDAAIVIGLLLIAVGAFCVVAHKEVMEILS